MATTLGTETQDQYILEALEAVVISPQTPINSTNSFEGSSTYSSPAEASYASLARSLASAAAAAAQAHSVGGFNEYTHEIPQMIPVLRGQDNCTPLQPSAGELEVPWQPVSAFSDWGSNRSSIAIYTPTPADQLEDPFEYDHSNIQDASSYDATTADPIPSYTPLQEDFAQFQAAIDMNSQSRQFSMNLVPTSNLIRRRQMTSFFAEMPASSTQRDSVPTESVDAFSAFTTSPKQTVFTSGPRSLETQGTIAARRNHTGPGVLGSLTLQPNGTTEVQVDSQLAELQSNEQSQPSFKLSSTDSNPNSFSDLPNVKTHIQFRKPSISSRAVDEKSPMGHETAGKSFAYHSSDNQGLNNTTQALSLTTGNEAAHVPELDFSTNAETPESASFSANDVAPIANGKDFHPLALPQQQLFIPFEYTERDNEILSSFYSMPSENSSGSSGLCLKESDSFPFDEFLHGDFEVISKGREEELKQRLEKHLTC